MAISKDLTRAIEWAEERLRNGAEPPFIYYRLMQLREAAQELLPHATRLEAGSLESSGRSETDPRLSDEASRPDNARRLHVVVCLQPQT